MNIHIGTKKVWRIEGSFQPSIFLEALKRILTPGDFLVFGCYEPAPLIHEKLLLLETSSQKLSPCVDTWCFEMNRRKYPRGRAYLVPFSDEAIDVLISLSGIKGGGGVRDVFFDDLIAYRGADGMTPLLFFHCAFLEGELLLSGIYSEEAVNAFASLLNSHMVIVDNSDRKL